MCVLLSYALNFAFLADLLWQALYIVPNALSFSLGFERSNSSFLDLFFKATISVY